MKLKQESDFSAKTKLLLERLKTQPVSSAALTLAEILIRQGKAKEALERLHTVEPYYKHTYRFAVLSARAHEALGNHHAAKQWLEQACVIAPQNEVAWRELIRLSAPAALRATSAAVATEPTRQSRLASTPSVAGASTSKQPTATPPVSLASQTGAHATATSAAKPELPTADAATQNAVPSAPARTAQAEMLATAAPAAEVPPSKEAPESEEKLLTEQDIFNDKGEFIGEFGSAAEKTMPEISFSPEPKPLPKYDKILDLSEIPVETSEPPALDIEPTALESEPPKISLDRAKLAQVLSRISRSEETLSAAAKTPHETNQAAPNAAPAQSEIIQNGNSAVSESAAAGEALTVEHSPHQTQPAEPDELEALAAALSNIKPLPVEETNDPTPIAEQRKPFDDDEEIKVPTRQLAEIFVSQGAFAKAIKVYEALAKKEPHNALLFNIIINGLKAQMGQPQKET